MRIRALLIFATYITSRSIDFRVNRPRVRIVDMVLMSDIEFLLSYRCAEDFKGLVLVNCSFEEKQSFEIIDVIRWVICLRSW